MNLNSKQFKFIFQPFFSSPRVPRVRTPSISSSVRCPPGVNPRPDFVDYLIPGQETEELSKIGSAQRRRPGESRVTLPARDPRQGLARDPRQGSSQTGRVPPIQVGPPAYLSIPGFEQCLEEFTPVGGQHSENCLPHRRPYNCTEQAWEGLQNVFEGDCPAGQRDPCLSTRPAEGACEPYLDRWTFDQGYIFQPISGRQKTKNFETFFESFASYFCTGLPF